MQERYDQLGDYFRNLPTQRYPHLVRMAPFMVQSGGDERLDFALDIMINGLDATAGGAAPTAGAAAPR